jgi:hypothetical protein
MQKNTTHSTRCDALRVASDRLDQSHILMAVSAMALGSGGRYAAQDILDAVGSEHMQLWHAPGVVLATEIRQYPRRKSLCLIGLVGKNPRSWMGMLSDIEDIARSWGCDLMESIHPDGFDRLLKTGGWRSRRAMWEKSL